MVYSFIKSIFVSFKGGYFNYFGLKELFLIKEKNYEKCKLIFYMEDRRKMSIMTG